MTPTYFFSAKTVTGFQKKGHKETLLPQDIKSPIHAVAYRGFPYYSSFKALLLKHLIT